eukprot:jgi/Phyca11/19155/fgenesh1_pg.PHYCAscaffold_44_\
MVFLLESNIISRKPVRILQLETKTYEKRVEEIVIENQFPTNANFKLSMTQQQQTGADATSSLATGVFPSSRGNRRRSVAGNQGVNSSVSFGEGKRNSVSGKLRAEDGEFSWCLAAQQPFYLPDFGTSGNSSGADADGSFAGISTATVAIRKNGSAKVKLEFLPLIPGTYRCQLLFLDENIGEFLDLRVYDLVAKVKEPNVKTQLEFVAPARHSIVQEIPLSNPTDTTWSLKAIFSPGKAPVSMFSGPPNLVVPAKRSATYPLTFTPSWMYHETRTFVLLNTATQQQFEFELSGYGEEPLAQDHVVLACQARSSIVYSFDVFALGSDNSTQTFKVESDLRDVVGASTISIPAGTNRRVKYPLTFSPLVSGSYFGSITFTNEATNEYLWYTVEASRTLQQFKTWTICLVLLETDQELQLQHRVSNTRNFSIKGSNNSVNSSSHVASDWEFAVRGRGRAPSVMKPLVVTARVHEAASTLFTFKNPFAVPLRVDVKLVAEASENSPPPSPRVKKKSGGLWRFDVSLDAGDPPVDDVLSIESSLNQTSSSGQLVICTDEMQWTFNVKGVYPDATPGSRTTGIGSSLSSSASRARLGITSEQRVERGRQRNTTK